MKKKYFTFSLFFLFFLFSCTSTTNIEQNLTYDELMLEGQKNYLSSNYKLAEQYYFEALKLYGNNLSNYIKTRYELGHLYISTKEYSKAYNSFIDIINIYNEDKTNSLPSGYKILSEKGIKSIPEEELTKITNKNEN